MKIKLAVLSEEKNTIPTSWTRNIPLSGVHEFDVFKKAIFMETGK
jgi:hypothetical protein